MRLIFTIRMLALSCTAMVFPGNGTLAATLDEATQSIQCFQLAMSASVISEELFDRYGIKTDPSHLSWARYAKLFAERSELQKKLLEDGKDRVVADMYQDDSEIEVISLVRKLRISGSLEDKSEFLFSVSELCLSKQ